MSSAESVGFLGPAYASSLAEFGEPVELPASGGWFLRRRLPGGAEMDGMGAYPYLVCRDWRRLGRDLDSLAGELISFAAAPDPFAPCGPAELEAAFPDLMVEFKPHHVADLSRPLAEIVSRRARRYAERALETLEVEFHPQPIALLEDWLGLFSHSVDRFGLSGIRAFSRAALAQQMQIPGCLMSVARLGQEVVAAHLWMTHAGAAYPYLAAPGPRSNELRAAYALYYAGLRYFAGKVGWIDWGGEPGVAASGTLGTFKQSFSTGVRPVYFCGRILDRERYDALCRRSGRTAARYFPAYREGEFG